MAVSAGGLSVPASRELSEPRGSQSQSSGGLCRSSLNAVSGCGENERLGARVGALCKSTARRGRASLTLQSFSALWTCHHPWTIGVLWRDCGNCQPTLFRRLPSISFKSENSKSQSGRSAVSVSAVWRSYAHVCVAFYHVVRTSSKASFR
jgi:hypothetical protein